MDPYRTAARTIDRDFKLDPSVSVIDRNIFTYLARPEEERNTEKSRLFHLLANVHEGLAVLYDVSADVAYRVVLPDGEHLDVRRHEAITMSAEDLFLHVCARMDQMQEAKRAAIPEVRGFRIGTKSPRRNKKMG